MMKRFAAICFALVLAGAAHAAEKRPFAIWGFGAGSCANFEKFYRQDPDMTDTLYFVWAQGYLSGLNEATPGDGFFNLGAKTDDEMKHYLRQYCNAHPLADFREGVLELKKTLPFVGPDITKPLPPLSDTGR